MEIIKNLNDELDTSITKEGTDATPVFVIKTFDPKTKKVYAEMKLQPKEFINKYGELLFEKNQRKKRKGEMEAQLVSKPWEKYPEMIKEEDKKLKGLEKQEKEQYSANYQLIKKLIPPAELKQLFARMRLEAPL